MKYENLVSHIVENIGGLENLDVADHCATRLRFKLKDTSLLDSEALEKVNGVLGVQIQSGMEAQIIVGPEVASIFEEFLKTTGFQGSGAESSTSSGSTKNKEKLTLKGIGTAIMNYLSGTVAPVIPIYLTAGMIMAVINLCTAFFGVNPDNGTVVVLNSVANAGFFFMPIVLGWVATNKLGADPALGAMLGMTLVFSEINGVEGLNFLGLPIYAATYNGTFLPMMLGSAFLAMVYRFFRDKIPQAVRYFLLPLVTMLIAVPVTLLLLGPAGYVVGTWISVVFEWLGAHVKVLAIALWSFLCPVAVMTGIDKAVFFLNMEHLNLVGFDNIFLPGGLAGNSAVGGAALAVWLLSHNEDTKQLGLTSGITAILGITEPALYGICVKLKKPLLGAMMGAAIGGAFAGIVNLKQYVYAGPGLMTAPVYISSDGSMYNIIMFFLTVAISVAAGFGCTYFLSKRSSQEEDQDSANTLSISAPTKGAIVEMKDIPDKVFSEGILGTCLGIEPVDGKIYSPVSGVITAFPDSNHAIGIETDDGLELLIHVGIDTVNMNGKGFSPKVKEGQRVKRGEVLLKIDIDQIKSQGYSPIVITAVTNSSAYPEIKTTSVNTVMPGTEIISISKNLDSEPVSD